MKNPIRKFIVTIVKEIVKEESKSLETYIKNEKSSFDVQVQKMIHGAYAGIVCAKCGKNVFANDNQTWVHGNGGNAYCMEPCWQQVKKENAKV